jgi:hypothetical protein
VSQPFLYELAFSSISLAIVKWIVPIFSGDIIQMVKNDLIAQLSAYNGELALIVSRQAV